MANTIIPAIYTKINLYHNLIKNVINIPKVLIKMEQNTKELIKKIVLSVFIGYAVIYMFYDIYSSIQICDSNVGIAGSQRFATEQFITYEHTRATSCAGLYTGTNKTYDCTTKDILTCKTDWNLYRFPWAR